MWLLAYHYTMYLIAVVLWNRAKNEVQLFDCKLVQLKPAAEAQWPHKSGIKLQSRGLIILCIAKSDMWVIASRLRVILIMGDW